MELSVTNRRGKVFTPFVLKLLIVMFLVEFVKGAMLLTILPVYMATVLHASAYVIGWTLAAQYIGDNVLRTPVGWIIDKIGYRACMVSGVVLTFAAIVMISSSSHYAWTIAACSVLGLGTAPLWPCVVTGATEVAGDEAKATVMSVVHMAWLSGVGLGPVVINLFIRGANYATSFRLLLGCMIVVMLVALLLPKHGKHKQAAVNIVSHVHDPKSPEQGAGKSSPQPWLRRARAYLREVRASMTVSPLLFPAMFLQTFALGVLTPILTLYAHQELGLTPGQYSLFLVAGGVVTVVLLVPVGRMVDRVGTKPFLTLGFAIGSATMLTFPFNHSLYVVYGLVSVIGVAYALIVPAWNALIAAAIPKEKRGAVWGFFLTIEGLGTIVGPIVSGKLWDVYGPHVPFMTSGAVLALLFVLQLLITRHKPQAPAAAH